ncbi:hypothetical protein BgiBS90_029325, partial [Biomphalaria glabrata]
CLEVNGIQGTTGDLGSRMSSSWSTTTSGHPSTVTPSICSYYDNPKETAGRSALGVHKGIDHGPRPLRCDNISFCFTYWNIDPQNSSHVIIQKQ